MMANPPSSRHRDPIWRPLPEVLAARPLVREAVPASRLGCCHSRLRSNASTRAARTR